MRWKTIRSAGYVAVTARPADGPMMRTTGNLPRETVEQFAALSAKYCDAVGETPFVYHERQLHSALLPAIARASNAVLAEHPIRRALSRADSRTSAYGWVDYWVLCGNTVLLVELKHVFRGATARDGALSPSSTPSRQTMRVAAGKPSNDEAGFRSRVTTRRAWF